MVQRLGLGVLTARVLVQALAGKLRSQKSSGKVRKRKRKVIGLNWCEVYT